MNLIVVEHGAVSLAKVSVDYGQHTAGSKFDWLDVLAGTLIPFVITIIILILFILNKI